MTTSTRSEKTAAGRVKRALLSLLPLSKSQMRAHLAQCVADFKADAMHHWERLALEGVLSGDTFPQDQEEYTEACLSILHWVPGVSEREVATVQAQTRG